MMIVDLIDEVDFNEKLIDAGVPLNVDQSMEEVQSTLSSWLQQYPEKRPYIEALFEEIQSSHTTILPEVNNVIKAIL